jgi:hypothetical protein
MRLQWPDFALDWPLRAKRQKLKCLIKKVKRSGGEGGIRTHVPELPDHPISSRRRYDHFGTSPVNLKSCLVYLSIYGVNLSIAAM